MLAVLVAGIDQDAIGSLRRRAGERAIEEELDPLDRRARGHHLRAHLGLPEERLAGDGPHDADLEGVGGGGEEEEGKEDYAESCR